MKRENWNNGVSKLDLNQLVSYCLVGELSILNKINISTFNNSNKRLTLIPSPSWSWSVRCVIMRIQSQTAIFLFPNGQESSINSPYVPRISPVVRLLNVRFRLLLHLAAILWNICKGRQHRDLPHAEMELTTITTQT